MPSAFDSFLPVMRSVDFGMSHNEKRELFPVKEEIAARKANGKNTSSVTRVILTCPNRKTIVKKRADLPKLPTLKSLGFFKLEQN
jgi:hypothetical protein